MPRKNLASELETNRNHSFEIKSVSGEAVTVPAGAAGAVVVAQLANYPVRNAAGNDIGGFGDTSLALSVSTAFTDEVAHGTADADLANGEYWVDYIRGEIRGRKASTSTSATAAYKIAVLNMSIDDTDVTLTIDQTGLATSAKQDTGNTSLSSIDTKLSSTTAQSLGTDATGADTYATIKTPSANAKHIAIYNGGSPDAIISLDAGTTDHFVAPGGSFAVYDNVTITSAVAIQAKNRVAGQNYTDLYVSIW